MKFNSAINVLGSVPDFNLVKDIYTREHPNIILPNFHILKNIKTDKSIKRFEKAISSTMLKFENKKLEVIFESILTNELNDDLLYYFLFLNTSINNDLFRYFNANVFFPALFSGRVMIRKEDACSCLLDLKNKHQELKDWSDSTLQTTASKYLTLLKKFNLLEGSVSKTIKVPYLNEKFFIIFLYFLKAVEEKTNLLNSEWIIYSFMEKGILIERILQKKYNKLYSINYTGDKLFLDTLLNYESIYATINNS